MSERNWFPAPAFFIAADFDDAPVVDRSPVPITTVLSKLQGEFHYTNRMLERELRRPFPDATRLREYRERMVYIRGEREQLLDALMWHEQTWAHLADDCVICNQTVGYTG